jgi:hypothetical protein
MASASSSCVTPRLIRTRARRVLGGSLSYGLWRAGDTRIKVAATADGVATGLPSIVARQSFGSQDEGRDTGVQGARELYQ